MSARRKPKQQPQAPVGWPQAFRDVVVASINQGQLPVLTGMLCMLAFLVRLPEAELSKLALEVLDGLLKGGLLGWVLAVVVSAFCVRHTRKMSKEFDKEYQRMGKEKSDIQRQAANVAYSSSDEP